MKIVYCDVPKSGGTYNFYRNLRTSLAKWAEVYCVSLGSNECSRWDNLFADEHCVQVGVDLNNDPLAISQALVSWITANKIDIFIPMSSYIAASAVPHLPKEVYVINRCSSITRHAYDIVCNNAYHVSRVVATSERQYRDLLMKRHIPVDKLILIPHGFNIDAFKTIAESRIRIASAPIRLGYIGRLEHQDKGCLYLGHLIGLLIDLDLDFSLDIIGNGPDEGELRRRLKRSVQSGQVRFLGRKANSEIPSALGNIDIFVMPSHFEGFPNSLGEAMAAGCVPVVSCILGVTDWIIRDGQTGYVCPIGKMQDFAQAIFNLAKDRQLLAKMSAAAAMDIAERFNLARMGFNYNQMFREVIAEPLSNTHPRPWEEFCVDPIYNSTWRRYVPQFAKAFARRWGIA